MSKLSRLSLTMLFLLLDIAYIQADDNTSINEDIRHAVYVLKGMDSDKPKSWAIEVLISAAQTDTIPYAMNCLGMAYMTGSGVKKDSAMALAWFEKAATQGFVDAYHNIGIMYKDGICGIKQNFPKAYNYFQLGVNAGSIVCHYDVGFMMYKGLGCQQNYKEAKEMFEKAAQKENVPAMYMLGLCYRNGYGVEQDTVQANIYLKNAALMNFTPAIEELLNPEPENRLYEDYHLGDNNGGKPTSMPEISPGKKDFSLVTDNYYGYIIMYDWSGRYVLGEKPVKMTIHNSDKDYLTGILIIDSDSISFSAKQTTDGRLKFSEGQLKLKERYNKGKFMPYKINDAVLNIEGAKLCGQLSLYSLKLKEPERPMYIELIKEDASIAGNNAIIHVTPNPFTYSFMASFQLETACQPIVRIFDQKGRLAYYQELGHFEAGVNNAKIIPNIKDGLYVLNIRANQQILRTLIVKK